MAEEKATTAKVVAKAARKEEAKVVEQHKNSANFKDEVNKAIYDAYHKDFEEYKRKVMRAFHLPNLKDIIAEEFKEAEGVVDV